MKQLFIVVLLTIAAMTGHAQTQTHTCGTKTQAGTACSRKVDKAGEKCWQHGGQTKAEKAGTQTAGTTSSECGAPTKAGGKCKNRVKGGGRCHLHKG